MRRHLILLPIAASLVLSACSTPVARPHGERGITATYTRGTLHATLPEPARVPAAIAAAEVLRARGYSIAESRSTEEVGEITARPPRTTDWPKLTILAERGPRGTNLSLFVTPFGDQELCRSVLDGMLRRLGL
jgi:hypothetical protein